MGMAGQKTMGPECTCEACTIAAAVDTSVSGSWTGLGTSSCSTSSSSGAAVTSQTSRSTATALQASATIDPTNTNEGGRVIIGYVDANNYHFAELRKGSSDGDLRLFHRSGGTNTQIGTTTTITGYTSGSKTVCVCYYNGKLYALVDSFVCSAAATITTGSAKAGLGTGTATATITFTNFIFEHHYIDDPTCPACCHRSSGDTTSPAYGFIFCSNCVAPYPEFVIATLAGLTNGTCANCGNFNTAYVLPYVGLESGPTCAYRANFSPKNCAIPTGTNLFTVEFIYGTNTGVPYWSFGLVENGISGTVSIAATSQPGTFWPCMELPPQDTMGCGGVFGACICTGAVVSAIGF